jgi:predicted permease
MLVQAAFSFVLLVGAGLFIRSLQRVTSLDLGFEPARAITASMSWPRATRSPAEAEVESARRRGVYLAALERLRATPGVEHAAIAVGTPFGNAYTVSLWVPGKDSIPDLGGGGPYISAVTSGYFEAAGMRLLQGRTFTHEDGAGTERVAVINEPMARALWPGEAAIGKCLQIFGKTIPCARVVGVVAEARRRALREPPAMQYYVPFGQEMAIGGSMMVVRPAGDPDAFVPTLRSVLLDVDPNLLSTRIEHLQDAIDPLTRSWRMGAMLFTIFGALALLIAAIGLYSVIAYIVAQRTQEFGVRMALGATSDRIVRLVLRDGMTAAGAGLVVGLTIAILSGRYVESLLFETSPYDPVVIAVAGVVLVASALIACYVPARRASRIDAAIALRAE